MHATKIARTVLALCAFSTAWGQPSPKGPHRLPARLNAPSPASANTPATGTHYKFIEIGPPNSPYAVADGINNSGMVSGYYLDMSSVFHGFAAYGGMFQTVDYPGASQTLLYGLNNLGVAIGYYTDSSGNNHVVTYTISTGKWGSLPDIPNYSQNDGYCINDAGYAVGNAYQGTASAAWIYNPGTSSYSFFTAPAAAPNSTFPSCINSKNEVAGYYVDPSGVYHGFLNAYGSIVTIDVPGATDTFPDGINNRGVVEGQIVSSGGALEGYVENVGGNYAIVNYPGAQATAIVGINEAGDLCGSEGGTNFANAKAFIAIKQP